MRDLTALFSPKSVAVVGASRFPEKVGAIVLKNIIESKFPGQVYPVNPNAEEVGGIRCIRDIGGLPEVVDLAVVALPAPLVLQTLEQIGQKGIKNVVVISAGFKETGHEGAKLEEELIKISSQYQLNVLGPNCLGFVNNLVPINVTFGETFAKPGNLRFISQSGAIAASIFDWCRSVDLGFSQFITLGNKAVLTENDILQYFGSLPKNASLSGVSSVDPIGMYLESITNGEQFLQITSQMTKINPIFILKPGKSTAAAAAMQSHTGAIAGEDAVLQTALDQAGIIRAQTLEDFFDLSKAFAWENSPLGPRVAIVSNAGGPAVVSADAVVKNGLELAQFDSETHEKMLQILPRSASVLNPIDVLGDALSDRFFKAGELVLQTNQVDSLVIILTPQIMTQIEQTAKFIGSLSQKYQKPIFCSFIGGSKVSEGEKILNNCKIPSFDYPEQAISIISKMWQFRKWSQEVQVNTEQAVDQQLDLTHIKTVIEKAISGNLPALDNLEANEILSLAGITTPRTALLDDFAQAKTFTQANGFPVVLKLSSPGLLHKKDVGGVITDIGNEDQLEAAWDKIKRQTTHLDQSLQNQIKIQIQKEILNGVEVIIGVKRDPTFGLVLLFGAGGTYAELIKDRNLHLLPIDILGAKKLVEKSKIFSILKGYRGGPPYELEKLYEVIVKLGNLAQVLPEISDIEINPLIVTLNNVWAVDGKVILKQQERKDTAAKFQTAKVTKQEILASKYHYFEFESEGPFNFEPGQYISVKVAADRVNCYSMSGRVGPNGFSLLVDTKPGGPGSKFFDNLDVGEKIAFLGPFGTFTLKLNDGATRLLFLGTGCGLSPLKCQIEAALRKYQSNLPITLYIGLNKADDLFWQDECLQLSKQYPNFHFKVAVSEPDSSWQGHTGFITELLKEDFPDSRGCSAYLCGNKNMIEDASRILLDGGCPPERIYTEKL